MSARRSHPKSRHGCRECKRRRVKCDEVQPSCFNCTRHGITCSLATLGLPPSHTRVPPSHARVPRTEAIEILTTAAPDPVRVVHPPPTTIPLPWDRGFELMHHYTLSTADTLASRMDMQHVWRVVLPEIGYDSYFVMHGIFMVSALHKAYLQPAPRNHYLYLAAHHQNVGLDGYTAALPTINDNNQDAFFGFAILLVVYACAFPNLTSKETSTAVAVHELFALIRGSGVVLDRFVPHMHKTKFAALSTGVWIVDPENANYRSPTLHLSGLPSDYFQALQDLSASLNRNLGEERRPHYAAAVAGLEKAAYLIAHAGAYVEAGMLLFWPSAVAEDIMVDIKSNNPYAIVVMCYFAVLCSVLEPSFWYLKGWSKRLLAMVDEHLLNMPVFMALVEWPRRRISELHSSN